MVFKLKSSAKHKYPDNFLTGFLRFSETAFRISVLLSLLLCLSCSEHSQQASASGNLVYSETEVRQSNVDTSSFRYLIYCLNHEIIPDKSLVRKFFPGDLPEYTQDDGYSFYTDISENFFLNGVHIIVFRLNEAGPGSEEITYYIASYRIDGLLLDFSQYHLPVITEWNNVESEFSMNKNGLLILSIKETMFAPENPGIKVLEIIRTRAYFSINKDGKITDSSTLP
jgi:hypothetical protein